MQSSKLVSFIVVLLFGLTILFSFASSIFYVIESTERGVIFYKFGKGLDKENVVQPGFNFKAPWNDLYKFDITDNLVEETITFASGRIKVILDGNEHEINADRDGTSSLLIPTRLHHEIKNIGNNPTSMLAFFPAVQPQIFPVRDK